MHQDIPNTLATPIVENKSRLAEGPMWRPEGIMWIDILSSMVFQKTNEGSLKKLKLPSHVGAVVEWNGSLLAATQQGFYPFEMNSGVGTRLAASPNLPSNVRFNDGKTDAMGRFYIGTMDYDGTKECGKLYRLDPDGTVHTLLENVTISNGLAWNKQKNLMYYIDTELDRVDVFDWEPKTGSIENRRIAFSTQSMKGSPDGMCIDPNGVLWIAFWGGSQVVAFNPETGRPLHQIQVPAPHTTSCCIGGKDNNELFITTAREGLTEDQLSTYPKSGALFSCPLPELELK